MIEKIQIVHNDFKESLERMPYESVGRLLMALIAFANDEDYAEIIEGDTPAQILFPTIKAHIIRQEEFRLSKSKAGKKGGELGGAPTGNSNASKTKQNKAPIPNPIPNPIPIKDIYGEANNVLLTKEEYQKIKDRGLTELIDELSLYMASKKKSYADHYMTILAWGRRREKEKENVIPLSGKDSKNQFNRFEQRTDYDLEALERKLIKN